MPTGDPNMPPRFYELSGSSKRSRPVWISEDEGEPGSFSDLDLDLSSDPLGSDSLPSSTGLDLPVFYGHNFQADSSDLVGAALKSPSLSQIRLQTSPQPPAEVNPPAKLARLEQSSTTKNLQARPVQGRRSCTSDGDAPSFAVLFLQAFLEEQKQQRQEEKEQRRLEMEMLRQQREEERDARRMEAEASERRFMLLFSKNFETS